MHNTPLSGLGGLHDNYKQSRKFKNRERKAAQHVVNQQLQRETHAAHAANSKNPKWAGVQKGGK
jgi:hypothetical protein